MPEIPPDFGDVTAEYAAAREGRGLATGTMALLWVKGPDAIDFVDGQVTQDVSAIPLGKVRRSLLLGPRGKLLALMWVLRGDDHIGLAVDAGTANSAMARLEEFRFRVDAEITLDDRPGHELWGGASEEIADEASLSPRRGWREIDGRLVAALEGRVMTRVLVVGDPAPLFAVGAIPIGSVALSTVRIEAGEPAMGVDFDESVIPQETGLVPEAVSFEKGCYVGQELVARIDARGRVNRRLAAMLIEENVVPPIGAEIRTGGEVRGSISRVGESLSLRAPVAWGLIRREVEDGDAVEIGWEGGSTTGVLRELPLDDFSEAAHTSLTSGSDGDGELTGA